MPDFLTDYFNSVTKNLFTTLNTPDAYLNKIALTAIIAIIGLLLHLLLKKIISHNASDLKRRYTLRKVSKSSIATLTILSILFIWIQAINALILMALLIVFFIVIMVRGLTNNIIGYFVIRYRRYFKIGHRIEIKGFIGDVIDISPVSFKLLEVRNWLSSDSDTGRIIKVPNSIIFEESVEIVGEENVFIWHEIKYVLSFDSDWQDAERIMTEAGDTYFNDIMLDELKESNKKMPIEQDVLEPVFSLNTNEEGIILILRYLVDYRNGTKTKTYLQRNILKQFDANHNIKFATLDIRILEK